MGHNRNESGVEQRIADPIEPYVMVTVSGKGAHGIRWNQKKRLGLAFIHYLRHCEQVGAGTPDNEREELKRVVDQFPDSLATNTKAPDALPSRFHDAFIDFRMATLKNTARFQKATAAVLFQGGDDSSPSQGTNGYGTGSKYGDPDMPTGSGYVPRDNGGRQQHPGWGATRGETHDGTRRGQ